MNIRNFFIKRTTFFLIVLVITTMVAFFSALNSYIYNEKQTPNPEPEKPIVAENPEGEADPSRMTLEMTTWVWQKDKKFTLTLPTSGKFTATTDCNSMGGNFGVKGNTILFSAIYSTKMYCEGSKEGEFSKMLENTSQFRFTSRGQLILIQKDGGEEEFR